MYDRKYDWQHAFEGLAAARKRAAFVRRSARKVAKDQRKYQRRLRRFVSEANAAINRKLWRWKIVMNNKKGDLQWL